MLFLEKLFFDFFVGRFFLLYCSEFLIKIAALICCGWAGTRAAIFQYSLNNEKRSGNFPDLFVFILLFIL
jgi:hypothetical protein